MNRQHYHTSFFFCVKHISQLNEMYVNYFLIFFLFRVSKKEMEDIMNEIYEGNKHNIDEIIKIVYDKPYNYLFINTDTQRMLKIFDELIISDNI